MLLIFHQPVSNYLALARQLPLSKTKAMKTQTEIERQIADLEIRLEKQILNGNIRISVESQLQTLRWVLKHPGFEELIPIQ